MSNRARIGKSGLNNTEITADNRPSFGVGVDVVSNLSYDDKGVDSQTITGSTYTPLAFPEDTSFPTTALIDMLGTVTAGSTTRDVFRPQASSTAIAVNTSGAPHFQVNVRGIVIRNAADLGAGTLLLQLDTSGSAPTVGAGATRPAAAALGRNTQRFEFPLSTTVAAPILFTAPFQLIADADIYASGAQVYASLVGGVTGSVSIVSASVLVCANHL